MAMVDAVASVMGRVDWSIVAQVAVVFVLGSLVGAAELLGRYRDNPLDALFSSPGGAYCLLNGIFSLAALYVVVVLMPSADGAGSGPIANVLIAAFGGAAVLRSAVLKSRIGDRDVSIGPAAFVETLLAVTDREVDRRRALDRAQYVPGLMEQASFEFVVQALLPTCLALMQNLSGEERSRVEAAIQGLATKGFLAETRAIVAGLMLSELVGRKVLEASMGSLAAVLARAKAAPPSIPATADLAKVILAGSRDAAGRDGDAP